MYSGGYEKDSRAMVSSNFSMLARESFLAHFKPSRLLRHSEDKQGGSSFLFRNLISDLSRIKKLPKNTVPPDILLFS